MGLNFLIEPVTFQGLLSIEEEKLGGGGGKWSRSGDSLTKQANGGVRAQEPSPG